MNGAAVVTLVLSGVPQHEKLKLMRMEEDALIKQRKKIKALLASKKLSSDDASDEDLKKKKKNTKKKKKSKKRKNCFSESDDSGDLSKRKLTDSSSSLKTPDLRNKLRDLHRYHFSNESEEVYRRRRSPPSRRLFKERSPSSRRLSRERSSSRRLSPDTKYPYRRIETKTEYMSPTSSKNRYKRERISSRDIVDRYIRDGSYSRPGSSRDSCRPRRRYSRSRSRSRSRESRYRRSRSRENEYRKDWRSDSRYDNRIVSPRPGLKAIQDAYRPNISEVFANKKNTTPKPRDELYSESILVKKKSPIKKEVDSDKVELDQKTMKEAIKEIVFHLSEHFENLCVVHDTTPDDRKRVLTELLENTLKRLEDVPTYPGMSVEALVMRYRCHSSKQEDKERLEKIFLSVLSSRQIEWNSSNIQNNELDLWFNLNELDDILDGLPSFMEDVKPKLETIEIDKEEGEIEDEDDKQIVSASEPVKYTRECRHSVELINKEHQELFTMNDPPYKVHITVNHKRCKRFYLPIKKLLRPLKQHMKEHREHIEIELFLHIGRLILEKRLMKLLENKDTKYRTPEIVQMYREVYPVEDDEIFVIETLCDIWRGLYNDDVHVDVVPKTFNHKVTNVDVAVKQEITEEMNEIKKEIDTDDKTIDTTETNAGKDIKKETVDTVVSIKQEKTPDITPQIKTENTTTDLPRNPEKETTPKIKTENTTNDTEKIQHEVSNDQRPIQKEKDGAAILTKIKIENDPNTSKEKLNQDDSCKNNIIVKKESELSVVKEEPNNGSKTTESNVVENINAGTQEVKKETVLISDDEEECAIIEVAEKIVIDDDDDENIVIPDDVKVFILDDDKIVIDDSGDEVKDSQDYDSDSTVILQVRTEPQNEQETITNKDVDPKSNEENHEANPHQSEGNVETIDGDKPADIMNNAVNDLLAPADVTGNVDVIMKQGDKEKDNPKDILDTFKNIDTEESVEKIQEFLQQM